MPDQIDAGIMAMHGPQNAYAVHAWLNTATGEVRFYVAGSVPDDFTALTKPDNSPLSPWRDHGIVALVRVQAEVMPDGTERRHASEPG